MNAVIFYVLGMSALLATLLCITRRNLVHAIIYLVNALFSLALMFYLLGAPLVAAWEVIIYAGAIMVLFLFVVMMLREIPAKPSAGPGWLRWGPLVVLSAILFTCTVLILVRDPLPAADLPVYYVSPRTFGQALFDRYGLGVEVISFQLLFAAAGAYYLGLCGAESPAEMKGQP